MFFLYRYFFLSINLVKNIAWFSNVKLTVFLEKNQLGGWVMNCRTSFANLFKVFPSVVMNETAI